MERGRHPAPPDKRSGDAEKTEQRCFCGRGFHKNQGIAPTLPPQRGSRSVAKVNHGRNSIRGSLSGQARQQSAFSRCFNERCRRLPLAARAADLPVPPAPPRLQHRHAFSRPSRAAATACAVATGMRANYVRTLFGPLMREAATGIRDGKFASAEKRDAS